MKDLECIKDLPTIEVSEDAISRATALEIYSDLYWMDERLLNFKDELDNVYEKLRTAPSVVPKEKEVIYGNEHNCIMTLFGECSYSKTGCGDCAVVEKVRDALAKTQMKTQNSNEKPKEDEWIPRYHQGVDKLICECSNCHTLHAITNFCPHCGAKMKGAEE